MCTYREVLIFVLSLPSSKAFYRSIPDRSLRLRVLCFYVIFLSSSPFSQYIRTGTKGCSPLPYNESSPSSSAPVANDGRRSRSYWGHARFRRKNRIMMCPFFSLTPTAPFHLAADRNAACANIIGP